MDGAKLLELVLQADSEKHESQQAYFIDDDLSDVLVDGRLNFERIAELITEHEFHSSAA